jgi:hypothetical protein
LVLAESSDESLESFPCCHDTEFTREPCLTHLRTESAATTRGMPWPSPRAERGGGQILAGREMRSLPRG